MYYARQTVFEDDLMHANGAQKANHKYVGRIADKNGKWRYFYTAEEMKAAMNGAKKQVSKMSNTIIQPRKYKTLEPLKGMNQKQWEAHLRKQKENSIGGRLNKLKAKAITQYALKKGQIQRGTKKAIDDFNHNLPWNVAQRKIRQAIDHRKMMKNVHEKMEYERRHPYDPQYWNMQTIQRKRKNSGRTIKSDIRRLADKYAK